MGAPASITTIGPAHRSKFITHEMLTASTAMATSAKDTYLVNKITFFHGGPFFATNCKYTMSVTLNKMQ